MTHRLISHDQQGQSNLTSSSKIKLSAPFTTREFSPPQTKHFVDQRSKEQDEIRQRVDSYVDDDAFRQNTVELNQEQQSEGHNYSKPFIEASREIKKGIDRRIRNLSQQFFSPQPRCVQIDVIDVEDDAISGQNFTAEIKRQERLSKSFVHSYRFDGSNTMRMQQSERSTMGIPNSFRDNSLTMRIGALNNPMISRDQPFQNRMSNSNGFIAAFNAYRNLKSQSKQRNYSFAQPGCQENFKYPKKRLDLMSQSIDLNPIQSYRMKQRRMGGSFIQQL